MHAGGKRPICSADRGQDELQQQSGRTCSSRERNDIIQPGSKENYMASVSEKMKNEIIRYLRQGLSTEQIASKTDVAFRVVTAIRACLTRGDYDSDEVIETVLEATFGLERDLQGALRSNIQQLETGLKIIDDGKEYATDAGRIDILAKDQKGTIVVIELKAGTAAPEALTQLLAYIGAVDKGKSIQVRGILIAGGFHEKVVFAAKAAPNIQLCRYRFKFTFEKIRSVKEIASDMT